jgi:hypothetical protein
MAQKKYRQTNQWNHIYIIHADSTIWIKQVYGDRSISNQGKRKWKLINVVGCIFNCLGKINGILTIHHEVNSKWVIENNA